VLKDFIGIVKIKNALAVTQIVSSVIQNQIVSNAKILHFLIWKTESVNVPSKKDVLLYVNQVSLRIQLTRVVIPVIPDVVNALV
jgi:hypothetical protein